MTSIPRTAHKSAKLVLRRALGFPQCKRPQTPESCRYHLNGIPGSAVSSPPLAGKSHRRISRARSGPPGGAPRTWYFLHQSLDIDDARSVTFGYDLGIIASVLPSSNFKETVGFPNATQEGFIVSMLLLGAFSANIYVGTLAGNCAP